MTLSDVVKVTVYLADLKDYPAFNALYQQYFTGDPPPVRTAVQAKIPLGALVEVDAIAVKTK